ncbi:hypothetical protein E8L99_18625 [Phreatobacter aquaticus]|uniref:Uncharacterized protein n=1 Tax=Phreatobacter aquaticus TaxID=2570229 RepID=A0A4D7QRT8_9HYPH|nr:hypothetical protein [Phreatobacter aquaticus]QCK87627.1 hypothetical protein E8L99_18625 [Phreatobacter aquaticus]
MDGERLRLARVVAVLAGLVASPPGPALAQTTDPSRLLSAIPTDIVLVRTTGSWSNGERTGPTRIVLLRAGTGDDAMRLFVQWLAVADPRTGRLASVATEEVPEIFDWRAVVDDYRVEPAPGGSRVILDATILTNQQARRYVLTIGQPGELMLSAR